MPASTILGSLNLLLLAKLVTARPGYNIKAWVFIFAITSSN